MRLQSSFMALSILRHNGTCSKSSTIFFTDSPFASRWKNCTRLGCGRVYSLKPPFNGCTSANEDKRFSIESLSKKMMSTSRVYQYQPHPFIIIKIRHQAVNSPKISNSQITVTHPVLTLTFIARRTQINIR